MTEYENVCRILFGATSGFEELLAHLPECLALCEASTGGPWYYDSYSRIKSAAQGLRHREWQRANLPETRGELDALTPEQWREICKTEPQTTVCRVPCQAGDTATEQGYTDALFVSMARTLLPILLRRVANAEAAIDSAREQGDTYVEGESGNLLSLAETLTPVQVAGLLLRISVLEDELRTGQPPKLTAEEKDELERLYAASLKRRAEDGGDWEDAP